MIDEFKEIFWNSFSAPEFKSDRVFEFWADLEIISDALAGPLYNITQDGNCDYVYHDKDNRFPGVVDSASFKNWASKLVDEYKIKLLEFKPKNEIEQSEHSVLLRKVEMMNKTVIMAYRIQKKRDGMRSGTNYEKSLFSFISNIISWMFIF